MKRKLTWFQYGICSVILIWGAIDCIYQFIGLLTNLWPAPPYAAFLWFLGVYFVPAIVIFFVFELIKHFIK